MRRWMSLSLMAVVVTSTAFAQDARLRRVDSGVLMTPWEAVGRLDIDGEGFCTAALIAPDLVLTAAHCLYDRETGKRFDASKVKFLAGWRDGRASAHRDVHRAIVHPGFDYSSDLTSGRVSRDLALLQLDRPIRNSQIVPFTTADEPVQGERIGVVSYAKDRSEAPSLQEVCTVLAEKDGMLVTSCSVDFGSSGAPIFSFVDGDAQIVSVISAKAEMDGENVSLGTSLSVPLKLLRATLSAEREVFQTVGIGSDELQRGGARNATGAKFVRP